MKPFALLSLLILSGCSFVQSHPDQISKGLGTGAYFGCQMLTADQKAITTKVIDNLQSKPSLIDAIQNPDPLVKGTEFFNVAFPVATTWASANATTAPYAALVVSAFQSIMDRCKAGMGTTIAGR